MKTKKITLTELRSLVKRIIKEENQYEKVPRFDKKDFINNRVVETDDLRIVLNYLDNPEYYLARYYDKNDNERESSYGSPNYEDVIYNIMDRFLSI